MAVPECMDERTFRNIARMNPNALNPDGTLRSLLEQYGEVMMRREADPSYRVAGPYVLAPDIDFLGIPQAQGKPLVFSAGSLKHVIRKHGAAVEVLSRLPEELGQCILGYVNPDSEGKLTFILDAKSENGNNIISVLRTDLNMNSVDVASVRSVHGKERDRLIENMGEAIDLGREFFLGEKTGAWLEIQGHIPDTSGVAEEILKRLQDALYTCDIPEGQRGKLVSVKPHEIGGPVMPDAELDRRIASALGLDAPHEFSEIEQNFTSALEEKFYIDLRMDRLTAREAESLYPEVFSTAGLLDEAEPVYHREWSGCQEFLTCAEAGSGHEWQATLITLDGSTTFTAFGPAEAYEYLCDLESEHFENSVRAQRGLYAEDVEHLKELTPLQRAANLDKGVYGIRTETLREAVADMPAGKYGGEAEAPVSKPPVPGKSPGAAASTGALSFESSIEAAKMSARAQEARMGLANPDKQQGAR